MRGKNYAVMLAEGGEKRNPEFHRFLVELKQNPRMKYKGEILYKQKSGKMNQFRIVTSFLMNEEGTEKEGVLIQFEDISEVLELRQKQKDSSQCFMASMVCLCLWIFFCMIWNLLGRPIHTNIMTYLVVCMGIVLFFYILKTTSFTMKDIGLGTENIKKVLYVDSMIAIGLVAAMVIFKIILLKVNPGFFEPGTPFLNWGELTIGTAIYVPVVVLQEFLSRGVLHENLRRIFVGKYSEVAAIVVSSLFFGVLHVYLGITYMCGAIILLSALGVLYLKQGTIWGLCIPHYVCGTAMVVLGFA